MWRVTYAVNSPFQFTLFDLATVFWAPTLGKVLQLGLFRRITFGGLFILFMLLQLFASALHFYWLVKICYSVRSLSRVQLFVTPWTEAHQPALSITNSWNLLRLLSIELVMPSNHLILCRPLLLPSIFPSIRVFPNESVLCIRWPKYWDFNFSISPSSEYSGLISFRIDWFDLLAVQGTLKGLLQHHSSKASILRHSAFFMVQLSHPYMTTGKNHSLD